MKLILDLESVEPLTGSVADPVTGATRPVAGWMSLMSVISDMTSSVRQRHSLPTVQDEPHSRAD